MLIEDGMDRREGRMKKKGGRRRTRGEKDDKGMSVSIQPRIEKSGNAGLRVPYLVSEGPIRGTVPIGCEGPRRDSLHHYILFIL